MTDRTGLGPTFPLGRFDVHRIGFGAMQLPGPGVMGPPKDHDQAVAVLRRAVELGVNHIDTAQYYGPDVANELIREALHPYPEDLALVSKVGAVRDAEGGWPPAQHPAELRAGVEDNLRSLGDRAAGRGQPAAAGPTRPATGHRRWRTSWPRWSALREEGKIAGIGISNASLEQVETAIGWPASSACRTRSAWLDRTTRPCCSGAPPRASRTCPSSRSARPFPACRR